MTWLECAVQAMMDFLSSIPVPVMVAGARVLIDAKPEITGVMRPLWEHIVFDRRYNADALGVRIHDWSDGSLEIIAKTIERRLHELAAG
jgi:hypothetical protein